jgi:hypothetical protein
MVETGSDSIKGIGYSIFLPTHRIREAAHPTQLEVVDDDLLLGFSVDVQQRTVQYRQPDLRQIRDCVSAGSVLLSMNELKSRAHLIRKCTYPPELISASLFALADLYVQRGFARPDSALHI